MESTHIHISDMKVLMEELTKVYKQMHGCDGQGTLPPSLHMVAKLVPQLGKEAWGALCAKAPSMGWCALECSFKDGHMHIRAPFMGVAGMHEGDQQKSCQEEDAPDTQEAFASREASLSENMSDSENMSIVDALLYSLLDVPFIKQLEQEVARAARGNTALAVVRLAFQGRISNGSCTDDFSQMLGADVLDELLREEPFFDKENSCVPHDSGSDALKDLAGSDGKNDENILFSSDVLKLVQNALQIHACSCDTLGVYQGEMILILPGAKIFAAQNLVEDILFYCKQQGYLLCAGISGNLGAHCSLAGLLEQSASALHDAVKQKVAVRLYRENMHALDARRTLVQSHEKRFLFGAV